MNTTLVDRETLGQFVDKLISIKYPVRSAEAYSSLREESIERLDDGIAERIFSSLTKSQLDELNRLLDGDGDDKGSGSSTSSDYEQFFKSVGVDIDETITTTLADFQNDFLGGDNAKSE